MDEKKVKKDRKKESLSTTKIMASAVASITVSLITTKLTSYMGSVIIVGVSSILIAVFAEFYSRILSKSRKIAARATAHVPYNRILPDRMSTALDKGLKHAMEDTTDSIPPITDDTEQVDEEDDDVQDNAHGFMGRFSSVTRYAIMFSIIALMTSGISWGVATFVEKPDVTNVTVQKVEKLSDAEKNAIKKAAADEVSAQIEKAQEQADDASSSTYTLGNRISSLETQVKSLQSSLDSLKKSVSSSQSSASTNDMERDEKISSLQSSIKTMESEIESLQTEVKALQSADSDSSSTSSSSE